MDGKICLKIVEFSYECFLQVLHTSSAVDIRTVIGQIETFWLQLRWPDAETAYVFISR